jgi:hypothetical protein
MQILLLRTYLPVCDVFPHFCLLPISISHTLVWTILGRNMFLALAFLCCKPFLKGFQVVVKHFPHLCELLVWEIESSHFWMGRTSLVEVPHTVHTWLSFVLLQRNMTINHNSFIEQKDAQTKCCCWLLTMARSYRRTANTLLLLLAS